MQHRTRDLLLRQQTQVINALRAHLAELGIVAAQGREGLKQLLAVITDEKDARLPIDARASLIVLAAQLQALHTMIGSIERRLIVQLVETPERGDHLLAHLVAVAADDSVIIARRRIGYVAPYPIMTIAMMALVARQTIASDSPYAASKGASMQNPAAQNPASI
jgi:transposase